jgi:hypothetical protein
MHKLVSRQTNLINRIERCGRHTEVVAKQFEPRGEAPGRLKARHAPYLPQVQLKLGDR